MSIAATAAPEAIVEHPSLTAHDRCDRCGAQAYVRWGKGTQDIVTCNHHSNKFEATLITQGFDIVQDNRSLINAKPSPSANV